jgi:hypothetical protein
MVINRDQFLLDIKYFINKSVTIDSQKRNAMNCNNAFSFDNNYEEEKEILYKIKLANYKNKKEQGDVLEELLKKLFNRIIFINSFSVTNRDTALGQIDISLTTIDETIYEIWGMIGDYPSCLIGECKNYKSNGVSRPEIEKTCWRACKGQALSFFIGKSFKEPAIQEIGNFNLYKQSFLSRSHGVYIIPMTIDMLDVVISHDLNFCYFIRWAIQASKKMAIANYL